MRCPPPFSVLCLMLPFYPRTFASRAKVLSLGKSVVVKRFCWNTSLQILQEDDRTSPSLLNTLVSGWQSSQRLHWLRIKVVQVPETLLRETPHWWLTPSPPPVLCVRLFAIRMLFRPNQDTGSLNLGRLPWYHTST